MQQARPAGEQALGITGVTKSRSRLAPATAAALGALGLVLMAAWVLLTCLTRDLQISRDGAAAAAGLACGLVGMLVVRRQPRNPEGWLLLGAAAGLFAVLVSGLYAVLDYRTHHGRLPAHRPAGCGPGGAWDMLLRCSRQSRRCWTAWESTRAGSSRRSCRTTAG